MAAPRKNLLDQVLVSGDEASAKRKPAGVAQLVEPPICKQRVGGSSPPTSFTRLPDGPEPLRYTVGFRGDYFAFEDFVHENEMMDIPQ